MPYCAQCGKMITEEILMKNNGECNGCLQVDKVIDSKLAVSGIKVPVAKFMTCSYCKKITEARCQICRKPVCETHLHTNSDGITLCKECDVDNTGICCFIGCVGIVFVFLILIVIGVF